MVCALSFLFTSVYLKIEPLTILEMLFLQIRSSRPIKVLNRYFNNVKNRMA